MKEETMGDESEWYGEQIEGQHEEEQAEVEIDWASIPQRKPEGLRLGGERRTVTCSACDGRGWYWIKVFVKNGEGQLIPAEQKKACAVCNASGRVEEI